MQNYRILWADDEIDFLKPHILFLEKKGYKVTGVKSGADAIEECENQHFDVVFLDENMPGMNGLEALGGIKALHPNVPVVMITKSEEENIMEEAIASKISDYLIKPVNPNQILLSIKKLLDKQRIITEKTNNDYRMDFHNISSSIMDDMDFEDWKEVYRKLVFWELEIENTENKSMSDVLQMQKDEANTNFAKFIRNRYEFWLNDAEEGQRPMLSYDIIEKGVLPVLQERPEGKPVFFILIDNLRLDQWRLFQPMLSQYFNVVEDELYYSILPTTTAYARNSIFAGFMPSEIKEEFPHYWVDDNEEGSKNNFEDKLLRIQLDDLGLEKLRMSYHKIIKNSHGKSVNESFNELLKNDLNVLVYNFVDMLSHARTDSDMIRELAPDEAAYRSVTKSWFQHSPLLEMFRLIAESGCPVVMTTDHGTIRTKRPFKIIGDRTTNTNLRYKQGKNLNYKGKNIFVAKKPENFFLPKNNVSSSYVFATEDYFFAYPNNYNYYVKYYKDTFQHGGVSMEEMIIPFVKMQPK